MISRNNLADSAATDTTRRRVASVWLRLAQAYKLSPEDTTREPRTETIEAWFRQIRYIGGEVVPDICRSTELGYELGGAFRIAYTCTCGLPALAAVPYEQLNGQRGYATICAVCDAATQMPRFS